VESEIYFIPFTIEDLGLSCSIADFPKHGGLACICSPHNENSKALELRSNVLNR
jgi:hypothetical protein